jgi:hypothetical protein
MADTDQTLHPADSNSTIESRARQRRYERNYAENVTVDAGTEEVLSFSDDFSELSSHMNKSSTMMMGERMEIFFDNERGRSVDSHVRMAGRMMGLDLTY